MKHCDVRTKMEAVDVLIMPEENMDPRLAKADAYLVASMLETTAAHECRDYTITITGFIVRLDFSAELNAPETRNEAADIASEIMIEACSRASLVPADWTVQWPGDAGAMPEAQ